MKHLIWGILGLLIGAFLLFSALVVMKDSPLSTVFYGAIFVGYGIYRIHQYYGTKASSGEKPQGPP